MEKEINKRLSLPKNRETFRGIFTLRRTASDGTYSFVIPDDLAVVKMLNALNGEFIINATKLI